MPRNPRPVVEPVDEPLNVKALAADNAALTEMGKRSAEIAELYADGTPYERERVISQATFHMGASAEAMLEAGKCLVQLKENERFGDFTAIVEQRLGLNVKTAQRMMAAAVKYLSPALASKATTLSLLGRSKLFDLMVESEEDLADLAEGGTIAGKSLDDMQAMTQRELKAALADARQQIAAKNKVIGKRDEKIARLEEKAEAALGPEEQALADLQSHVLTAQTGLMQLFALVKEFAEQDLTDEFRNLVNGDVTYLAQIFEQLIVEGGIPVDFQEMAVPSWMTNGGGRKKKAA